MQRTPAGLPSGIPGIGDEIDGAMQQAPQPARQLNPSLLMRDHCGNQGRAAASMSKDSRIEGDMPQPSLY